MKIVKGFLNPLLITFAFLTVTGCSTPSKTTSFDFTKMSCGVGFVKHFKYDEVEILKFKSQKNKSVLLTGKIDGVEECKTYPCTTCKLFMCKDPQFTEIKYYNEAENRIFSMTGKKTNDRNTNHVDKWIHRDTIKGSNADYVFNITHREGYEYEQVFNINNGYLVYEIATPIKVDKEIYISPCDVKALDTYSSFYTSYQIQ